MNTMNIYVFIAEFLEELFFTSLFFLLVVDIYETIQIRLLYARDSSTAVGNKEGEMMH